jgi:hypothetical protein
MEDLKNISVEEKKSFSLPPGATVISKSTNMSVREIKNGFILRKSYDIKWKAAGSDENQYEYYTDEWYSKDNPISITMPKDKSLAESLDD